MSNAVPRAVLLLALLLAPVGGCAHRSSAPGASQGPAAEERTTIRIENHRLLDHAIYVSRSGVRQRLGEARGLGSTTLVIPIAVVGAGAQLRFVASPIGGGAAEVSETIYVAPGEQVELVIMGM